MSKPVRHNHVTRDIKPPGICQVCDQFHALADRLAYERERLAQGTCPSSGKRTMHDGRLRPACAICECGEPEDIR